MGAIRICTISLVIFVVTTACRGERPPEPVTDTFPVKVTQVPQSDSKEFRESYVVERGDTLIAIADRFGIHLNDLVSENNIADPTMIYVGQVLLIPPPPDADEGPLLTIAPPTDPSLPKLQPTTSN